MENSNQSLMEDGTDAKKFQIAGEDIVLVPCAKQDFHKVNSLAENYLLVRHLDYTNYIISEREKILWEVNPLKN